jgi:hypothetical protein
MKQSCSSRRELSNGMSHVVCSQVFRVDSRLLVVGSQNRQTPRSSTPGPSFGHNLRFRRSNEQCDPILDICTLRAFHWYKERHKPLRFDPSNRSLKFWGSTGTPSPKAGVALGVWRFTPSHFPTLLGVPDVTPGLPFGPHPCNPFALVASPKLGLWHPTWEFTWECVGSCLHTLCTPGSMWCDSRVFILARHLPTLCLGREPKVRVATSWVLEPKWTPKFLERNFRGQNPLDWDVLYIIRHLLEFRCLKRARMTHLDTSSTNYGQKKGRKSNW